MKMRARKFFIENSFNKFPVIFFRKSKNSVFQISMVLFPELV
ncbi:unnamed protein product [Haemonchus placei]|uniref:Serpin domain-containing protein n=1 Tax=Haemonchus placei TaxID=6290 RepID=A0A0N4VZS8_HAEPC|nr:unnamed protein product [Haemonchus placei]